MPVVSSLHVFFWFVFFFLFWFCFVLFLFFFVGFFGFVLVFFVGFFLFASFFVLVLFCFCFAFFCFVCFFGEVLVLFGFFFLFGFVFLFFFPLSLFPTAVFWIVSSISDPSFPQGHSQLVKFDGRKIPFHAVSFAPDYWKNLVSFSF